jgi:regulator of protease activity HflC (stomatin/prohibitin superfamily)
MTKIKAILAGAISLAIVLYGLWLIAKWGVMRVYVAPEEALVVINKFGNSLPSDRVVVPKEDNSFKGVQEEVLGPGRYFFNPVEYDHRIVPLVQIPAGSPEHWTFKTDGSLNDSGTAPMIGLVTLKQGQTPPPGVEVVKPGQKGIQEQVLTPGTYKINPFLYDVKLEPAVVVPPGSVGVVTRLSGDVGQVASATLSAIRASTSGPSTQPNDVANANGPSRLVVGPTQRGILRDVLQPGIYYLNPRLLKVTVVPVGYDAITLEDSTSKNGIRFYSYDGYLVEADFTVVWGRAPADAPNIVANIGNYEKIETNVINPAMKAACQNEGAKYTAKELIQGSTRSKFQDDLSASLEKQVASRNIHVLLALIRNISIKDNTTGKDQTQGLLATIQRANIEIERDLTNKQKTETATVAAQLEQALKQVDVARETVASESNVKVANILADGNKQAAEIDAQRDLEVANIEAQIAQLDSQRTQILGKATADVQRFKNEAEAKGAKLLIDAFGSPQAYNNYIFAKNFEPADLKLIFAGPGTFWTDLKSFQDVGASQMMQQGAQPQQPQKK